MRSSAATGLIVQAGSEDKVRGRFMADERHEEDQREEWREE